MFSVNVHGCYSNDKTCHACVVELSDIQEGAGEERGSGQRNTDGKNLDTQPLWERMGGVAEMVFI